MTTADAQPSSEHPEPQARDSAAPFGERALTGAPNPLERIDHLFEHTSRRIWLGVLGIALLLAAVVVWSAVAKQTITEDAPTVIVPQAGIFRAGELASGTVTSVLVREGDTVRRGQPLAQFQPPGEPAVQSVRSPLAGQVISVQARAGDVSRPGAPLFLVAPRTRPMAIAFVASADVSQLAVGQPVAVTVNGVSPDRYGEAIGRVAAIGPIPVNDQRLQQLTGDASLLGLSRSLGPTREVRIALTPAATPSGLAWTGGPGPAGPLPLGVRALSSITVQRETLIGKVLG
jgi:multidrug efflux pump subunit AcrA (membrane-fusion protein)